MELTRKAPTPARDKVEAMGFVLQDEMRTLHEHLTKGTDWEVLVIALAFEPKGGHGRTVRKGNITTRGIGISMVASIRAYADELEASMNEGKKP